jgi:ribosomal-protein-alanine N-acetyltransferase
MESPVFQRQDQFASENQKQRRTMFPQEILTDRLRLRPPTVADADRMFTRYSRNPEVCRYLSWTPHQSIDDTHEYLRRISRENADGTSEGYLIFSRDSDELLGSVGGRIQSHQIQFGYCLARDCWGQGYATEAARAFVAAAMDEPQNWRDQAFCDLENRASAHVLEKVGLTLEGVLRRYLVMPNISSEPRDMFCYAKVR